MSYNDDYDYSANSGNVDNTQVINTSDYAQSYENSGYAYSDNYKPKEAGVTGQKSTLRHNTFYNYSDNDQAHGKSNKRLIPMFVVLALIFFSFLTLKNCGGDPTVSTPTVTKTVTETPSPTSTTPDINKDELKERGEELGRQAKDSLNKAKELGDGIVKGFNSSN